MGTRRCLYAGADLSAAELRRAARVRGLGDEIALVRARLVKRVARGRATDRYVLEHVTALARLVVAQSRAAGAEDEGLASVVRSVLVGPLGPLAALAAGRASEEDADGGEA